MKARRMGGEPVAACSARPRWRRALGAGFVAMLLAACGGGGDGAVGSGGTGTATPTVGSGTASATPAVSAGTISGFGSVIVNGVRYDDAKATVIDDAGAVRGSASLRLGMQVEVRGSDNADGLSGTADSIRVSDEARGPVSAIDVAAGTLRVLGIPVKVGTATIYDGVTGLAGLALGDIVEVHGRADRSTDLVSATRVQKLPAYVAGAVLDARATLRNLNRTALTFSLGAMTIDYSRANYDRATLTGLASGPGDGLRIRATAARLPAGSTWQVDTLALVPAADTSGVSSASLEGKIADFVAPARFTVDGVPVDASAATVSGGSAAAFANGLEVHVRGTMVAGVLKAASVAIEVEDPAGTEFEVKGPITAFVSSANFTVRGVVVDASGTGVSFSGGTARDLALGRTVEVHGRILGSVARATEVGF
jgi:hypothetical protein